MKMTHIHLTLLLILQFSPSLIFAQQQAPREDAFTEQNEKMRSLEIQLSELVKEQSEKKAAAGEAIKKAESITREISEATSRLAQSPKDKKQENELRKLQREGKKADRAARKAGEELAATESKIKVLQETIRAEESNPSALTAGQASSLNPGAGQPAVTYAADSSDAAVSASAGNAGTGISQQTGSQGGPEMIRKVVEETYKNYPQQNGQPNIIINNIIVPSDYARGGKESPDSFGLTAEEVAEYRAWRSRQYDSRYSIPRHAAYEPDERYRRPAEGSAFRERFAELPKRKSGLWVIPMIGLHASSFDMDFDNNEAKGRSGWNAGLDFRAHFNRFFIQPGAHYFSSSMDLTTSDSLSNTPLTFGPRIHSIRVPVLAGLYLTRAQGAFFKFNLKGGIVGNYVLDVDKNDHGFSTDNLERYSYGVNGGFGLEFGFVTIDLSHEWGISRFVKGSDSKNNMLRATLGFKL